MSQKKLRIAIFTETFLPKIDGIVRVLTLCLRGLREMGHEVVLFGPKGGAPTYEGHEIVGVGGPPVPMYPELKINIVKPFVPRKLKQFKPDIIHAVHPTFLGPYGIYYARKHRIPLLVSYHTHIGLYANFYGYPWVVNPYWKATRWVHNFGDLNLGPSTFMRDDLTAHGINKAHWWIRGIDHEFFSPGPVNPTMRNRMTDGNPDQFLLGYVGRLAPEKGLFDLRDNLFPMDNLRLVFVGDGPSAAKLREHHKGTPTVFTGYLTGQDLIDAYRSLDAFIFPSTTETFGLVGLEAMGCGIPTIGARAGGIPDFLTHNETGLSYDPKHKVLMRDYVQQLMHDPALRERLSAAGRARAEQIHWFDMVKDLENYYYQTIEEAQMSGRVPITA